jgi:hypothetical protein
MALALSRNSNQFKEALQRIRYAAGNVAWPSRNHYMVDWIHNNQEDGILTDITAGPGATVQKKRLSLIEALPASDTEFSVIPTEKLPTRAAAIEDGDIAFFGSTRADLDVFHMGMVFRSEAQLFLRHASRTAGRVCEQPLSEFLAGNRTTGIILVRPLWRA